MTIHTLLPKLPDPEVLRERSIRLAMLDAICDADVDVRTHTFEPQWSDGVAVATMDNSVDTHRVVFDRAGVVAFGFDHESPVSPWSGRRGRSPGLPDDQELWPGLLDGLPESLARHAGEPSFLVDGDLLATVCFWRLDSDSRWHCGPVEFGADVDDGAEWLFSRLVDWSTQDIVEHVRENCEFSTVDVEAVRRIAEGEPVSPGLAAAINLDADFAQVAADARRIGHPTAE